MAIEDYSNEPNMSRTEDILQATIDGKPYDKAPHSRVEYLLIELKEAIEAGEVDPTIFATAISLSVNTSTYVMTAQLLNENGEAIGEPQNIDLPLESTVISGSYDNQTRSLILTLVSGQTISIPIGDLISGLQATIDDSNPLTAAYVSETNDRKFAYMDANGNLFIGGTQVTQLIDKDSYDALVTKDNVFYLVYPTPANNGGA